MTKCTKCKQIIELKPEKVPRIATKPYCRLCYPGVKIRTHYGGKMLPRYQEWYNLSQKRDKANHNALNRKLTPLEKRKQKRKLLQKSLWGN